jgi:hypothetical protein
MRIDLIIKHLENIVKMHVPASSEDRESALKALEIIKETINK